MQSPYRAGRSSRMNPARESSRRTTIQTPLIAAPLISGRTNGGALAS
jgi:hypothetical protein